ncbi:MAG: hypothetical protein ABIJ12_10755 [bacterium]
MCDTENIKYLLQNIWTNKISSAYSSGNISSEATLVAELYRCIKAYSPLNVWLEHRINYTKEKKSGPFDLIITDNLKIKCIIEVKFFPGSQKLYKPDLEKLLSITEMTTDTYLRTNPISGEWDINYPYKVIENPLCVFAVIGYSDLKALDTKNIPEIILHLTGSVGNGKCEFCQGLPVSADTR